MADDQDHQQLVSQFAEMTQASIENVGIGDKSFYLTKLTAPVLALSRSQQLEC